MSLRQTDWLWMLFSSTEADMILRLGCRSLFLPGGNFQMIYRVLKVIEWSLYHRLSVCWEFYISEIRVGERVQEREGARDRERGAPM